MSTVLSSRRFVGSERMAVKSGEAAGADRKNVSIAVVVLLAGFAALFLGAVGEINLLMCAGFIALATSGLFLNGMFWAHMQEKGLYRPEDHYHNRGL
ncbi:MAG: hypothetical protein LBU64_12440 [Planctomycetota bacterium]|nr:hypothetical protein [Planctomycetota bacterium]